MVVLKLGGSLFDSARMLVSRLAAYAKEKERCILIVPGGSIFADTVRRAGASDDASHWMAILAMEQYAWYLLDGTGADGTEELHIKKPGVHVLLPYRLLRERDELAHSWDVTADTIAAWVARELGSRLIKLTDVDGIYTGGELVREINASELPDESCVDRALPGFLKENSMDCLVVNGRCFGSVIGAIESKNTGTCIRGI